MIELSSRPGRKAAAVHPSSRSLSAEIDGHLRAGLAVLVLSIDLRDAACDREAMLRALAQVTRRTLRPTDRVVAGSGVTLLGYVADADPDWAGERFDDVVDRFVATSPGARVGCAEAQIGDDARSLIDRARAGTARARLDTRRFEDPSGG